MMDHAWRPGRAIAGSLRQSQGRLIDHLLFFVRELWNVAISPPAVCHFVSPSLAMRRRPPAFFLVPSFSDTFRRPPYSLSRGIAYGARGARRVLSSVAQNAKRIRAHLRSTRRTSPGTA